MDWQTYESDFLASVQAAEKGSLSERLNSFFEAEISLYFELCPIQDVFRFRARHFGLRIARLLINEKGELQATLVSKLASQLGKEQYSLGPKREGDALIYGHLLSCLTALDTTKELWQWIRKFSIPLCHRRAEEIIRETLWPEPIQALQTFHVRRAALAGWLTVLRQTTGSCFATAPAILIQKRPIQFFKDLYELLSLGQLKRVLDGKEYAVPMCASIGSSELEKPIAFPDRLAFSPGLIAALSAAGLFAAAESMKNKIISLQSALRTLDKIHTPGQVLRDLILKNLGISEADVVEEEYLAKIQMGPMIAREGAVFYQRPSPRAQKVAESKKRHKSACLAFQALTECILLRTWEYTIASFCDVKTDFAKWNLYIGLGMHMDKDGGIAHFLYERIDQELKSANDEVLKLNHQYEQSVYAVRSLEALLHRAGDAQRYELQAQMTRAVNEMQLSLRERDRHVQRAEAIAGFFKTLMQSYDVKLQEYFQEVFDPSVSDTPEHFFEDSPAGFRLLYKHGRADASLWELIYDEKGYIQALCSFFSAVERDIELSPFLESDFVSKITTELIQFIQKLDFIEGAKQRSRSIGKKSPWDYVSGGTMQSLVQAYYNRHQPLTEASVIPRSELDLVRFLEKTKGKQERLMHSPTHAFLLKTDLFPEKAEEKIKINKNTAKQWKCGEEIQEYLGHSLSEKLPNKERALFLHLLQRKNVAETPMQLRQMLIDTLKTACNRTNLEEIVDAHLYEHTFLLSGARVKEMLRAVFDPWPHPFIARALAQVELSFTGPFALHQIAKSILLQGLRSPNTSIDWDERIASRMRSLELTYPHLLLFADTNWSGWFFGFVFNMFTDKLELWRLNRIGTQGYPMNDWKQWLSPSNQSPWILLARPQEYDS